MSALLEYWKTKGATHYIVDEAGNPAMAYKKDETGWSYLSYAGIWLGATSKRLDEVALVIPEDYQCPCPPNT